MPMLTDQDGQVVVSYAMCFRTQSGKKAMLLGEQLENVDLSVMQSNVIVQSVARARAWMKMLDSGEAANVKEIAEKVGVDRPYVSKCLRLATVSPRIIRAVLRGRAPDQISIEKLVSLESDDWEEQECAVGLL